MNGNALPAIALVVGVPFFGIYPAYLFRKRRLSLESLVVYLSFTAWVIMMVLGAFLDNGFLLISSFVLMLITAGLAIALRMEMLRDAYTVDISPDEPLKLRWLVAFSSSFWVWFAYRHGPLLAAVLNVSVTYLLVIGTIAILTLFIGHSFPLGLFAAIYAFISLIQLRDVYRQLCEKTERC